MSSREWDHIGAVEERFHALFGDRQLEGREGFLVSIERSVPDRRSSELVDHFEHSLGIVFEPIDVDHDGDAIDRDGAGET